MRILGLIVEYNPFHNGHLHHIEQSKKICHADYTVCVMSGNFVQRGEPAIINKWARTKMALAFGVDLVIELPFPYALSSAERFAFGAVKILDSIGVINCLCFGSEHGDISDFEYLAQILVEEPELYRVLLKSELDKGLSFPSAREFALKKYIKTTDDPKNTDVKNLISASNNILGIEYLKALKQLNSKIIPFTIKRIGNDYNDECITDKISSATSIRSFIRNNPISVWEDTLKRVLPKTSFDILHHEIAAGRGPVFQKDFFRIVTALIRRLRAEEIKNHVHISEGLENRIKNAAGKCETYEQLIQAICTKRYTKTRVQRILMGILIGMTSEQLDTFGANNGPQYARILGFNDRGKQLISLMNQKSSIPTIIKSADYIKLHSPVLKDMLELEALATDIYVLGYKSPKFRVSGQDFTNNIIIADNKIGGIVPP